MISEVIVITEVPRHRREARVKQKDCLNTLNCLDVHKEVTSEKTRGVVESTYISQSIALSQNKISDGGAVLNLKLLHFSARASLGGAGSTAGNNPGRRLRCL